MTSTPSPITTISMHIGDSAVSRLYTYADPTPPILHIGERGASVMFCLADRAVTDQQLAGVLKFLDDVRKFAAEVERIHAAAKVRHLGVASDFDAAADQAIAVVHGGGE